MLGGRGDKRVVFFQTGSKKSSYLLELGISFKDGKKITTNGAQIKFTLVNTPDIFCIEHGGHEEQ